MKFGIRITFATIEQFRNGRFKNLDVPIEFSFPYRMEIYRLIVLHINEIIQFLKEWNVEVLSIHSPQGRIDDTEFLRRIEQMAIFSEHFDRVPIVVHPSDFDKREYKKFTPEDKFFIQSKTLQTLKWIKNLYDITIGMETFTSTHRIFTIEDIISFNLPMVVDTSHIINEEYLAYILNNYTDNIIEVHLSSNKNGKEHQPIDNYCITVIETLKKKDWKGHFILEYMPEYSNTLISDCKYLIKAYG